MSIVNVTGITRRLSEGGLFDISFKVSKGERFCLFGDAGSGKSALLAILSGRLAPEQGDVKTLDVSPAESTARIGAVLQSELLRQSSPRHIILAALSAARVPSSQRPARLAEALHVSGLFQRSDQPVREMNQTAVIELRLATAIAVRPDLLLLDDLTKVLPPSRHVAWWQYLDDRRSEDGLTIVHATTLSTEAEAADRVMVLDRGRMLGCDRPSVLLAQCRGEEIVVDAADTDRVDRTLRRMPGVYSVSTQEGTRFYSEDGAGEAGKLFRQAASSLRSVFVRRPTLWDYLSEAVAS